MGDSELLSIQSSSIPSKVCVINETGFVSPFFFFLFFFPEEFAHRIMFAGHFHYFFLTVRTVSAGAIFAILLAEIIKEASTHLW